MQKEIIAKVIELCNTYGFQINQKYFYENLDSEEGLSGWEGYSKVAELHLEAVMSEGQLKENLENFGRKFANCAESKGYGLYNDIDYSKYTGNELKFRILLLKRI